MLHAVVMGAGTRANSARRASIAKDLQGYNEVCVLSGIPFLLRCLLTVLFLFYSLALPVMLFLRSDAIAYCIFAALI